MFIVSTLVCCNNGITTISLLLEMLAIFGVYGMLLWQRWIHDFCLKGALTIFSHWGRMSSIWRLEGFIKNSVLNAVVRVSPPKLLWDEQKRNVCKIVGPINQSWFVPQIHHCFDSNPGSNTACTKLDLHVSCLMLRWSSDDAVRGPTDSSELLTSALFSLPPNCVVTLSSDKQRVLCHTFLLLYKRLM